MMRTVTFRNPPRTSGTYVTTTVQARVAATLGDQTSGFARRRTIGANEIILFEFLMPSVVPFTMRDTWVPLDMLFLDEYGRIVWMVEWAQARRVEPYVSPVSFRYAMEFPGGWLRKQGISPRTLVGWNLA